MYTSRQSKSVVSSITLFFLILISGAPRCWSQNEFPLKDGDTWVMLGDSITAQHLHSNYFEAFCFARFPKWTFCFRNSGVGGSTITSGLARFDYDVALWKPTVVSVELGMNDSGAGPDSTPTYVKNMETLTERIRAIGARPVFFTSSAVNDGTSSANLAGRNLTLDRYATALKEFAAKQNAPFANQFHGLLDIWAKNKTIEDIHRCADMVRATVGRPNLPGADLLRQWLEVWANSEIAKQGASLMGDGVHPGPPGQLTMCASLLLDLKAPGMVSKATIDAAGRVGELVDCQVTNVKVEQRVVSFDRKDERLPMPIPDDARTGLVVYPAIADLSQWLLTVTNLKPGNYEVKIDGAPVATVSADQLAKGWNMGLLARGSVADQCRQILALVADKERLVTQWRQLSPTVTKTPTDENKAALEKLTQQVLEADAKIRKAAQPKTHHFEIVPAQ